MIEKLLEKWNRIKGKGCCMGESSGMERNLLLMDSILRNVRWVLIGFNGFPNTALGY